MDQASFNDLKKNRGAIFNAFKNQIKQNRNIKVQFDKVWERPLINLNESMTLNIVYGDEMPKKVNRSYNKYLAKDKLYIAPLKQDHL